eukprot:scaffold7852_cov66-Cyclotella_meneghiniana.AAC.1
MISIASSSAHSKFVSVFGGSQTFATRYTSKIANRTSRKRSNPFVTAGYQPTAKELLDCDLTVNDYNRVLPVIDASVILSPVQHRKNSSRSGTLAAQKLIDGRRAFGAAMKKELVESTRDDTVRKLYALDGHGVPRSLLEHLTHTGYFWLENIPTSTTSTVHLSLRNTPNSTMFDRERILKTNSSGATSLTKWPTEWDDDLELFLVSMNRIGSRLSSAVMSSDNNFIVPADLEKWQVSIRKGADHGTCRKDDSKRDTTSLLFEGVYCSMDT